MDQVHNIIDLKHFEGHVLAVVMVMIDYSKCILQFALNKSKECLTV